MLLSPLPAKSVVNRVVPKNAFDNYTSTRQRKQMVDLIERIKWTHKLSVETVNLSGKEITELQIFEIELRKREQITDLLEVIDKAIPYPIIFHVSYQEETFLSAAKKHRHPTNEDVSVIDWTFSNDWLTNDVVFSLNLERNLDHVFFNLCKKLTGRFNSAKSISDLVVFEKRYIELTKAIEKQKSLISGCKQFNKKVELNTQLAKMKEQLNVLLSEV